MTAAGVEDGERDVSDSIDGVEVGVTLRPADQGRKSE